MVRGWWGVILRPLPDGSPTYGPVYITIVVPDMHQSGVGKHHGRARGDATAVRRHRSARRLALPAYPSDSCFDSHLAPSERSLVSSQKYYVHSTMLAANKQQTPPGYLGSGAVG